MAGTVTASEVKHTSVKKVTFSWTSNAAGAASGDTTYSYDGEIICVVQSPTTGVAQPSDNYDVTVKDSANVDVLGGLGANLSNAADTVKNKASGDELGAVAGSKLSLSVTNAGDSKIGSTIIYIR